MSEYIEGIVEEWSLVDEILAAHRNVEVLIFVEGISVVSIRSINLHSTCPQ
jgi:hypothetical protein